MSGSWYTWSCRKPVLRQANRYGSQELINLPQHEHSSIVHVVTEAFLADDIDSGEFQHQQGAGQLLDRNLRRCDGTRAISGFLFGSRWWRKRSGEQPEAGISKQQVIPAYRFFR